MTKSPDNNSPSNDSSFYEDRMLELLDALGLKRSLGRMTKFLSGVDRCPHCVTAHPTLVLYWRSGGFVDRNTPGDKQVWAAYGCSSCGGMLLAKGMDNDHVEEPEIQAFFPALREVHPDIPEPARRYLSQAKDTLHAPDASAVMSASAVDAMLKHMGLHEGSVYARIDQAVQKNIITKNMAEWAHAVRLGSNRPRHADRRQPHVTAEEARQSFKFAEALAYYVFVLTAVIERGKMAASNLSDRPDL